MRQVEDMIGLKKSFIYREIAKGKFPSQIKIGNVARWRESDIDNWIDQLTANESM
ncbi:MAG: AlpA family phage regulatory protein [Amphritea sp.]